MSIADEERDAIVGYRLEKSRKTYSDARRLYELGMYSVCANRMYYALFYAMSALLLKNGITAHTHAGIMTMVHLNFVQKGLLSVEEGKILRKAFSLRQESDYDDFMIVSKEDIEVLIDPVSALLSHVAELARK